MGEIITLSVAPVVTRFHFHRDITFGLLLNMYVNWLHQPEKYILLVQSDVKKNSLCKYFCLIRVLI